MLVESAAVAPATRDNRRSAPLYRWHRRAGVLAASVLVYLLATGVLLQFSGSLNLGARFVSASAVLDWYGLQAPAEVLSSADLFSIDDALFAERRRIAPLEGFRGALRYQGVLLAAGESELLLLVPEDYSVIERVHLPPGIRRIGRTREHVVLDTANGRLVADPELVNWLPTTLVEADVRWSALEPADPAAATFYQGLFRKRMLTAERLLQDLHSGRLFGTAGVVVIDVASALLLFLAVSGLVLWWRGLTRRS